MGNQCGIQQKLELVYNKKIVSIEYINRSKYQIGLDLGGKWAGAVIKRRGIRGPKFYFPPKF